jgi:hypothetical protein
MLLVLRADLKVLEWARSWQYRLARFRERCRDLFGREA